MAAATARGRSADDEVVVVVMGDGRGPPLSVAVHTFCTLPSVFVVCLPAPSTSHIYLFLRSMSQKPSLAWFVFAMHFTEFRRVDGWMISHLFIPH